MIKIKKALCLLAAAAAAICLLPCAASAGNGWFFKAAGHSQPVCYGGDSRVDEYGTLYLGAEGDKKVYLTFDAGYLNDNVYSIAETLRGHSAKAAFFILPAVVNSDAEFVKALDADGHFICNHTWSHSNVSGMGPDQLRSELERLEAHCLEKTGVEMKKYFRPPEGSFSLKTLEYCRELGYSPVFWSFAYADWDASAQKDPEWALDKILSNLHDGMVLLLHPTSATNAAVMDRLLTAIEEAGYGFGTLDELCESQYGADAESSGFIQGNPDAGNRVALTFDDGPHPEYTVEILDILAEYGVKATFFVIGKNAETYPGIVERIIAEGHEVGNHTWSHSAVAELTDGELADEITRTENYLRNSFGYVPVLFRPPGGGRYARAAEVAEKLGYDYVLWSWRTDSRDWSCPGSEVISNTVISNTSGGDIVLLHDYASPVSQTPEALRKIIPALLEKGYGFVTVSELLSCS